MDNATRTKEVEYGNRALEFVAKLRSTQKIKTDLPTIEPGSPEWQAWEKYFHSYLNFDPWIMGAVRAEQRMKMTVPTQWPEWFDTDYAASAK